MLREYAQAGTMNPGGTWAKKSVTVRDANGQLWHKQVEAMVNCAYLPVPPGEQIAYQMLMQNQARMREMRESNAQTQQRVSNLRIVVDRDWHDAGDVCAGERAEPRADKCVLSGKLVEVR